MTNFTVYSFVLNMAYLAVALVLIRMVIWYLNWSTGLHFSEHVLEKIKTDPKALALYFGLRFFGLCYLAAAFLR
jgi:hypothetical protein